MPTGPLISLYANAATDYGAGSANLAELTAGDAHDDTEHTRAELGVDFVALETDIAKLAALQPGTARAGTRRPHRRPASFLTGSSEKMT